MELIQRNANRDEGYHGQAPRGSIGIWNPERKALSISLRNSWAIEAVLRCEPLWQIKQDLFAIYGLPTTRHELEAFLAGK